MTGLDESEVKSGAISNLRKMLKDGRAKRLGGLVEKPAAASAAAPGAVEIHVIKPAEAPEAIGIEGSPAEESHESPLEAKLEGDEPPAHAPGSIHALVMKKLDQVLRPKKG